MAASTSTSSGLPVSSSTISLISIVISLFALIVTVAKLRVQSQQQREIERQSQELEKQGKEIKRQSDQLERHGDELENQSTAMESEFTTDIYVENAKPVMNKLELWVSNLGYGRGKHLEIKTQILVDGDSSYTQPHRKSLTRVDSDDQRSSCVIEDGEEMVEFEVEPLVRIDLPDSECRNVAFQSGIEQLKQFAEENIEVEMNLCDKDALDNESESQVFDTLQVASTEEIGQYPSLESMINAGEY